MKPHFTTRPANPCPKSFLERLLASQKFNQGYATVEYLSAAYLDMAWHTLTDTELRDVRSFEDAELKRIGLIPEIVVRYRTTYFNHIFSSALGYSAGYYSYIWSEILDADGFAAFKESDDLYDHKS